MAKKNFIKKEDVLIALKSQIKELSNESNKDVVERGYFAECLVQIEEIERKAQYYDAIKWANKTGWEFRCEFMMDLDEMDELLREYKRDIELKMAYENEVQ